MEGVLDDDFVKKERLNSFSELKQRLIDNGITNFYEHKNGSIIVKEGDAVKVAILLKDGTIETMPKFPTIGNTIQIISTTVLLLMLLYVPFIIFPFQWILAIFCGQLVSYFIHMPRSKKLRDKAARLPSS